MAYFVDLSVGVNFRFPRLALPRLWREVETIRTSEVGPYTIIPPQEAYLDPPLTPSILIIGLDSASPYFQELTSSTVPRGSRRDDPESGGLFRV